MKPEPLKDKGFRNILRNDKKMKVYWEEDIKSAVEWYKCYQDKYKLRSDYPKLFKEYYYQRRYKKKRLSYELWLLNKAFEDIIKVRK